MDSLLLIFLMSSMCTMSNLALDRNDSGTGIAILVRRRNIDMVEYFQNNQRKACNEDSNYGTYLVVEDQCIENMYLFNECSYAITPRFTLFITNGAPIATEERQRTNPIILTYMNTSQLVNSSFCHIASLEVYRGREQAIEISHSGFSLGDNGTIEIYEDQLAYNSTEYEGELYRMNISCSDEGLPEAGCLFFKAFGATSIKDAKFNCTVPGTMLSNTTECPLTVMSTASSNTYQEPTTTLSLTFTMATEEPMRNDNPSVNLPVFEIGSPLFYGVVGTGGVAIIALFSLIGICIVLVCSREYQCRDTFILKEQEIDKEGQPAPTQYEDVDVENMNTVGHNIEDSLKPQMHTTQQQLLAKECSQTMSVSNPAYIHLGPEESSQVAPTSPSKCSKNPAYIHLDPEESSQDVLISSSKYSKNPAYIHFGPEESSQDVLISPSTYYKSSKNPAYIHLDPEESSQDVQISPNKCSKNPAYIHSDPEESALKMS